MPGTPERFEGLERFDRVDATNEQAMFLAFLDRIDVIPDFVRRRQRSYELLRIVPGHRTVDVGCGLGTAAREIALHAGPAGSTWGIDLSEAMIAEAIRRTAGSGVSVRFQKAGAEQLPFESGSLDGYRAERLYQHVHDPGHALAEARRCLVNRGRLVLTDQDWDAVFFDAADLAAAREIYRVYSDSFVNGTVGRTYRRLLLDAGFVDVHIEVDAVASADAEQYGFAVDLYARRARASNVEGKKVDAWVADQRERIATGRFFLLMTHFIASAMRPE
jgi:ubiquinone/menaquinone biosynthesis C-methylase UbiE